MPQSEFLFDARKARGLEERLCQAWGWKNEVIGDGKKCDLGSKLLTFLKVGITTLGYHEACLW